MQVGYAFKLGNVSAKIQWWDDTAPKDEYFDDDYLIMWDVDNGTILARSLMMGKAFNDGLSPTECVTDFKRKVEEVVEQMTGTDIDGDGDVGNSQEGIAEFLEEVARIFNERVDVWVARIGGTNGKSTV